MASNHIIPHSLSLQGAPYQIPVADLSHGAPGPTILITGGMDGDEYTGIRSAYELIEYYSKTPFPGRIIIVSIVNVPGFYEAKSLNPLDGKYPKYIFPGNKNGSSTEQLVDWLNTNFVKDADAWIDLHSGAITERMRPFVWGWQTRNKRLNALTKSIFSALDSDLYVYEKAPFLSKAARLASKNCMYLVFERGERGEQKNEEIEKMVEWVKKTVDVINGEKVKEKKIEVFEKVKYYSAPFDGMWIPSIDQGKVEKGNIAGFLESLDGSKRETITARESGKILWMKSTLSAEKGDELIVIATLKKEITPY